MGGAIAGMHYVGMAAMRIPGRMRYHPRRRCASVAIAVAAAGASSGSFCAPRGDESPRGRQRKAGAAVVHGRGHRGDALHGHGGRRVPRRRRTR